MQIAHLLSRKFKWAFTASMIFCTVLPVQGVQAADIPFSSSVTINTESCIIELEENGAFGISPNFRQMDARFRNVGGRPGIAMVTSRRRSDGAGPGAPFELTFEPPTTFTSAPAGTTTNLAWDSWFRGFDVSNGSRFGIQTGETSYALANTGISKTRVWTYLRVGNRDGAFRSGEYQAEGVLRCE